VIVATNAGSRSCTVYSFQWPLAQFRSLYRPFDLRVPSDMRRQRAWRLPADVDGNARITAQPHGSIHKTTEREGAFPHPAVVHAWTPRGNGAICPQKVARCAGYLVIDEEGRPGPSDRRCRARSGIRLRGFLYNNYYVVRSCPWELSGAVNDFLIHLNTHSSVVTCSSVTALTALCRGEVKGG
jgi:hypothetical protein